MVKIAYSNNFLRSAKKLPSDQQEKLAKLLVILRKDPFHPLLHCKPLVGELSGLYSFRITRPWRVVFRFIDPQTVQLVEAAHRKDIYRY